MSNNETEVVNQPTAFLLYPRKQPVMSAYYTRRVRFRDRGKHFVKMVHAVSEWRRPSSCKKIFFPPFLMGERGGGVDDILLGTTCLLTHGEWKMLVVLFAQLMAKICWQTAIFFCAFKSLPQNTQWPGLPQMPTVSFAYTSALLDKCTNIEHLVFFCVTWRELADWIRAFWTYSFEI